MQELNRTMHKINELRNPSPRRRTEKRKRENAFDKYDAMRQNRISSQEANRRFFNSLLDTKLPQSNIHENSQLLKSEMEKIKIPIKNFLYRPRHKTNVSDKVKNLLLLKKDLKKDKKEKQKNNLYVPPKPPRKVNANRQLLKKELREGKTMSKKNYLYVPHKSPNTNTNTTQKVKGSAI